LLDLLYARVLGARRRWFERHPEARRRLTRPVISVGNLSVGGTAKTPMVSAIARWLIERGERPAILSRGYGRRNRRDGVVVVSDGNRALAELDEAGDEPLMLAAELPGAVVAVAEDRFLAGVVAERRLDATVHVLDDGFQHVQLVRDFDVLMTSAGEAMNARVLPFGRLRESVGAAARADIVVVLDADFATARAEAWTLGVSQSVAARRRLDFRGASSAAGASGALGASTGWNAAAGAPVVAVAGIAHPDRFFQMLRDAGCNVAAALSFPDHHRYGPRDVARVDRTARWAGTDTVVTTRKDLVRWQPLGPLPFDCIAIPLELELDGWETLTASLEQAIARAREAA
jgi:tetraacyldisaccharide 4'-kinase